MVYSYRERHAKRMVEDWAYGVDLRRQAREYQQRRRSSVEYRQAQAAYLRQRYAALDGEGKKRESARTRAVKLKLIYGLSGEDYQAMLLSQGGVCAICRQPDRRRLSIDHDHKTGRVRALLCSGCNGGLGLFKDDPTTLRRAIRYLEDPEWH